MEKDEIRMKKDDAQIKKGDITVTNGDISKHNSYPDAIVGIGAVKVRPRYTSFDTSTLEKIIVEILREDGEWETVETQRVRIKAKSEYSPIIQNKAINDFTKISKRDLRDPEKSKDEKDRIKVAGEQKQKKLVALKGVAKVEIADYDELPRLLSASTMQLLDIILLKLTKHNEINRILELTLDEYMEQRGLKDKKTARKTLVDDLAVLQKTLLTYDYRVNGKRQYLEVSSIITSIGYQPKARTRFFIEMNSSFYRCYTGDTFGSIMQYPTALSRINTQRNPYSYYLGRKISELKRMNAGKRNEDIISVRRLLESAPFPSYEEVANSGRQITQRIIEPFQRDMNALDDIGLFKWDYCHSGGLLLTDEEYNSFDYQMSYDIFCGLFVKIVWYDYPLFEKRKRKTKTK